jgi:hypothetical protein
MAEALLSTGRVNTVLRMPQAHSNLAPWLDAQPQAVLPSPLITIRHCVEARLSALHQDCCHAQFKRI